MRLIAKIWEAETDIPRHLVNCLMRREAAMLAVNVKHKATRKKPILEDRSAVNTSPTGMMVKM